MSSQSLNTAFGFVYEVYTDKLQKPQEVVVVVCLRCGRPLTNEKSRLARLGPKCARKLAYETRTRSFSAKTLLRHKLLLRSSQVESIPTQDISLYYNSNSSHRPYCKIGTVFLPSTDICTPDDYNYRKKTYSLPLLEGIIYELYECLPQVKVFLLQVQNQQLRDIRSSITNSNNS